MLSASDAQSTSSTTTPEGGRLATARTSSFRLLYRGGLSLPDSDLLLDGLIFTTTVTDSPMKLLDNPLALALESMRGRPSLRFLGTTPLKDVWLDCTDGVVMLSLSAKKFILLTPAWRINRSIHPQAVLSRVYFENMFCLAPIPADSTSKYGVQVALGDSDGSETTTIIIYARCAPTTGYPSSEPLPVILHVARISPPPPSFVSSRSRLPRPDDPTPRIPPTLLSKRGLMQNKAQAVGIKRPKASASDGAQVETMRRAREVMLNIPRPPTEAGDVKKDVFKVPLVPASKTKGKAAEDPFLADATADELEKANKLIIKKSAVRALTTLGVPKHHPEYQELFSFVYRGATFALRRQLKLALVEVEKVDPMTEAHARMYVGYETGNNMATAATAECRDEYLMTLTRDAG